MKRRIKVLIYIVIILLGVYSVVSTMAMVDITQDYDELLDKYNEVVESYKSLSKEHFGDILEETPSTPLVIESVAKSIDSRASVSVMDNVVNMYVPYSSDIKEKVEEFVWSIPISLNTYGYKSCVIMVVDENGKCVFGWTILSNGDNYVLLSE